MEEGNGCGVAAIEAGYRLIEGLTSAEADYLPTPGLNYGGALLMILLVLVVSLPRPRWLRHRLS